MQHVHSPGLVNSFNSCLEILKEKAIQLVDLLFSFCFWVGVLVIETFVQYHKWYGQTMTIVKCKMFALNSLAMISQFQKAIAIPFGVFINRITTNCLNWRSNPARDCSVEWCHQLQPALVVHTFYPNFSTWTWFKHYKWWEVGFTLGRNYWFLTAAMHAHDVARKGFHGFTLPIRRVV